MMTDLDIDQRLRGVLAEVLALPAGRVAGFTDASGLFGHLPEFDSLAFANLLSAIEEAFGIFIYDDEIDADIFATYGTLRAYVTGKCVAGKAQAG